MFIILNGVRIEWYDDTLSYEDIVLINQYLEKSNNEHYVPSVTWKDKTANQSGILYRGQFVKVTDGMIISVFETGDA